MDAVDVEIRPATLEDLETVIALRIALLREHADNPIYGRLRPDASRRARKLFSAQLAAGNEVTLLAFPDPVQSAIGILRCIETAGSPLLYPERYAYVSSVYVEPAFRRRGVLSRMIDEAERWSRARGLEEMRLHNVSDYSLAGVAWEALGFVVVEQVRLRRLS
jgi:ribosomal protein S18 acetylase RimI-like enzyme